MQNDIINFRIPGELKRQFSWLCRRQSQTMTSQLNFLIRKHLREYEMDGISHQSGMNSNLRFSQDSTSSDQPASIVSSIENEGSNNIWQGF